MPHLAHKDAEAAVRRLARRTLRRGRAADSHPEDVAKLHRLRCAVRRLRFALEWLGRESGQMVRLQDAIGAVCDRAIARRCLQGVSGQRCEARRRKLAQQIRDGARFSLRFWQNAKPALEAVA